MLDQVADQSGRCQRSQDILPAAIETLAQVSQNRRQNATAATGRRSDDNATGSILFGNSQSIGPEQAIAFKIRAVK